MKRRNLTIIAFAAAIGVAVAGSGVAVAASQSSDDDAPLTGSAYDNAVRAALESTGGEGEVTDTEVGDDGAAMSVEIRLPDGRQVEVNLDENFAVIGTEADDDGPGDRDGDSD